MGSVPEMDTVIDLFLRAHRTCEADLSSLIRHVLRLRYGDDWLTQLQAADIREPESIPSALRLIRATPDSFMPLFATDQLDKVVTVLGEVNHVRNAIAHNRTSGLSGMDVQQAYEQVMWLLEVIRAAQRTAGFDEETTPHTTATFPQDIANPYIAGGPVREFFNRQLELSEVMQHVAKGQHVSVVGPAPDRQDFILART